MCLIGFSVIQTVVRMEVASPPPGISMKAQLDGACTKDSDHS